MGALLTGGRSILPQGIQLGALAGALVGIQGALLTCFDRRLEALWLSNRGHYYLAGDLSSRKGTPVSQSEILMAQRRVLWPDKRSVLPDCMSL